jgi:hypothetical protein
MARAKTKGSEAGKLIPYLQAGRLKKALPRLIEQKLGLEARTTAATMSIPAAGRLYYDLGRALSYQVSYPINPED